MATELLLGDEAVGLAAIHAGISGVFSYPGTPATEIFEFIERQAKHRPGIAASWSANEKVAYEEALGMSFVGKRSLVSMKHVGLNVAADPFMSSALTGANGALVLAVADDPGMHSSQNEQDSRFYGDFACVPGFEPSTQQEAYDMTREAFRLSERLSLPVIVRLVTRLSHSRANVVTADPSQPDPTIPSRGESRDWTLLPVNARRRYRRLLELQPKLIDYSEKSAFNRLTLNGPRGILTTGLAHNYVREVIGASPSCSVLKIGVYPVPTELVRRLVDHCDEILVIEEGHPYVESQLRGLLGVPGKAIRGKRDGTLPRDGEMTADVVRRALGVEVRETLEAVDDLPARPPALCQGCPHCDTFRAIKDAVGGEVEPILFSDIGCYTLGALPPYQAVQSCVDMGASIGMAHGAAKAGAHPVICTIGDSTFTHSGMTPLIGAAHENANITVIVLDNATVAMTGGQDVFVSGETLVELIRGLGVDPGHLHHIRPHAKFHDEQVELIRREIAHRGLSVIVASRPCIHTRRKAADTKSTAEPAAISD